MIKLLLKCNKTMCSGLILEPDKVISDIHMFVIVIVKNKSLIRTVIIHII